MKSVRIRSYSGSHFPALGLNEYREVHRIFPYSVWMQENADQNNSEYGHFFRSEFVINTLVTIIKSLSIAF